MTAKTTILQPFPEYEWSSIFDLYQDSRPMNRLGVDIAALTEEDIAEIADYYSKLK